MRPRVYTDTSVLGGCEDDEFREPSHRPPTIEDGAIGAPMRADALHIALATVARVDVLVSWNFKHIVNLKRIHAYNAVTLKKGYPLLEIRTPREVPGDE